MVRAVYPSGGSLELRINRYSEKLLVGGSNDAKVGAAQQATLWRWATRMQEETQSQRVRRVADMAGRYNSIAELVLALEGQVL